MSEAMALSPQKTKRHRHRSPRRKLAQSIVLIVGAPLLLLTVLALSVELIEYQPAAMPKLPERESLRPVVVHPSQVPVQVQIGSPALPPIDGAPSGLSLRSE